jgi:hypothetical protein
MSWFSSATIAFALVAGSTGTGTVRAAPACNDFLLALSKKPANLEFVKCEPGSRFQLRALVATYRVKGNHASEIEAYLVRHSGMAKLRFYCCGWEPNTRQSPPEGKLNIGLKQQYDVSMESEETLISERSRWSGIQWFYVSVTLLLEDAYSPVRNIGDRWCLEE